jgi:hypothetical protein
MTTDKPQDSVDQDSVDQEGCPPSEPDPGCDPHIVDTVACEASGVAAQAAYNASYAEALAKAKADYDTARTGFAVTHRDVAAKLGEQEHLIATKLDTIRCLLKHEWRWTCMDDAFCEVVHELECCFPPDAPCCVTECEYKVEGASGWSRAKLTKRIAKYQAMTDDAKACFDRLVGEAAALQARFDAAVAAVAAIDTTSTADLNRTYVSALAAQRDLSLVWRGFEQTHQYVDCLCLALTCWTKGCSAVSVLTGALAVVECGEEAATARCESLRTNTIDEVLAVVDKKCADKPCGDSTDGGSDGGSDGDDCEDEGSDGGSHHHHHHGKPGKQGCGCGGSGSSQAE